MTSPLWSHSGDDERAPEFDVDTTSGRLIRDAVRMLLAPDTGVVVEDAVLVVEEMVANAREHGGSPRRCRLRLQSGPNRLRIEVDDSGADDPRVRTPNSAGGRGMIVIDRLATAWGVIRHPEFKTVWAELPLDKPNYSPMSSA
ncbi:ATP-binding protein [Nocardia sp. NBC_01327]|uniref:ATP-binding protein n=1 Tax=Nocardia sp. NBC_01327 TaxID=2903593 RepID=UPI002E146812|nr:ATP-binding protein [Nocardia sp. NBC_01327]